MKITVDQLGSLHKSDRVLYGYILPVAHGVDGNFVEIDESKLVPLQRKLLAAWAKKNGIQEEPTQHEIKTCGCDTCFQKRTAEDQAKEKKRLGAKAAAQRLLQYMREQGLRDSEHNRQQWASFEAQLPKGVVLSADLIDKFIEGYHSVLEWDTPSPAPAPAAPAPVRVLANGEPELPLDASEAEMRRASIPQLQDLSRRRGEGKSWFNKAGRSAGNIDTGNQWQVR